MPKLKPGTILTAPANVEFSRQQIDRIAETSMTYREVEAAYGEDVAIRVGAARDPDNPELTAEDFARMRPAAEVDPRPRRGVPAAPAASRRHRPRKR